MKLYRFPLSIIFLVLLSLSILPADSASPTRIVAIGDVHGAYDAFAKILRESQLINDKNQWSGGNAILVQTGDILDRGPDSKKVLDLLMALEKEASKQKGKVVPLLGNHEVMNLIGDLRYVSPEEYASYSDSNSAKRQSAAYKTYESFMKQRSKKLGKDLPVEAEEEWKKKHPAGFIEHREAFASTGKYGKWLRKLNAIHTIDGSIFLHGGISSATSDIPIDKMNRRIQQEIRTFDKCSQTLQQRKAALPFFTMDEFLEAARDEVEILKSKSSSELDNSVSKELEDCLNIQTWLIIHPEGPLWFRGFASWDDTEGAQNANQLLEKYKASRFVTGHSVQQTGQINTRFDSKIILIDTGMLDSYFPGGRASALEILDGKITAIYADKRQPIPAN
jgi:hypothetical protein